MRFALVGYGRMGREIEKVALARGHRRVAVFHPSAKGARSFREIRPATLRGVEVAFEFTRPAAAEANVVALLERNVPVVCGTTGWDLASLPVRSAAKKSRAGVVLAANFSVGMNLFYRVVEEAAKLYSASGRFDPYVLELHHRGKADVPSGTARRLASLIASKSSPRTAVRTGETASPLAPGEVHVAGVRAGHEPGTHTVGFDGEDDVVTLTHRARGRASFALGAVLAAEWVLGKRGVHEFDEVLAELVRGRKGARW